MRKMTKTFRERIKSLDRITVVSQQRTEDNGSDVARNDVEAEAASGITPI